MKPGVPFRWSGRFPYTFLYLKKTKVLKPVRLQMSDMADENCVWDRPNTLSPPPSSFTSLYHPLPFEAFATPYLQPSKIRWCPSFRSDLRQEWIHHGMVRPPLPLIVYITSKKTTGTRILPEPASLYRFRQEQMSLYKYQFLDGRGLWNCSRWPSSELSPTALVFVLHLN